MPHGTGSSERVKGLTNFPTSRSAFNHAVVLTAQ
jgi:hypothetical protein